MKLPIIPKPERFTVNGWILPSEPLYPLPSPEPDLGLELELELEDRAVLCSDKNDWISSSAAIAASMTAVFWKMYSVARREKSVIFFGTLGMLGVGVDVDVDVEVGVEEWVLG